jgi:hypothetical protein
MVQPPFTILGKAESGRIVSVLYILNRQYYPLKRQRGLC